MHATDTDDTETVELTIEPETVKLDIRVIDE
jgi:hypothetical protein